MGGLLTTQLNSDLEDKFPSNELFRHDGGGIDILEMAKRVHASLKDDDIKIGIAVPAGTGIIIAYRKSEEYGSYIYFDYFQNKVLGIKCNNCTWTVV